MKEASKKEEEAAKKKVPQQGWVCPVCGAGNAPWAHTCGYCKGRTIERHVRPVGHPWIIDNG